MNEFYVKVLASIVATLTTAAVIANLTVLWSLNERVARIETQMALRVAKQ